ncbi:MAG: methyltransferase domain-containing protein [Bacteroidota bacterium]
MKKLKHLEAVALVLKDSAFPLNIQDIANQIKNRQLLPITKTTKIESFRVAVNRDIKDNGHKSIFVRVKKGVYEINRERVNDFFQNSHQQKVESSDIKDKVLVFPTTKLYEIGYFDGIEKSYEKYTNVLLSNNYPKFIDRFSAESNPHFKQIVSYVLIKYKDSLLRFQRTQSNEFEEYTDGYYSIGFGGHVQESDINLFSVDLNDSGLSESVKREIKEEAGIDLHLEPHTIKTIGVLNDDSTPLGQHHFAIIQLIELKSPKFKDNDEELDINSLEFVNFDSISLEFGLYEYWSQQCLQKFFKKKLTFKTFIKTSKDFPLNENANYITVIGGIGSGKSSACSIMENDFDFIRVPCSKIMQEIIGCGTIEDIGRKAFQEEGLKFITSKNGHQQLAEGIVNYIKQRPKKRYLIDGLRYVETLDALIRILKKPIMVLYIDNSKKRRYEFFTTRDNATISFNEFKRIINHPVERQLKKFYPKAKVAIFNHGSYKDYQQSIKDYFNKELFDDPWDVNAKRRHEQLVSNIDLTFSNVLVPKIVEILLSQKDCSDFSLLEIGCGTGVLTKTLAPKVKDVVAIDPSKKSIEIAEAYNLNNDNIKFKCIGIENYITKDSLFDFIVAHMVFNNLAPLEKAINNIAQSLKQDGLFVFTIPHPCFFAERKRTMFKNYTYSKSSFHKISFTISNDPKPLPRRTPYYHRSLENYHSALIKSGFYCVRLIEPFPDDTTLKKYPQENMWDYPHSIIFECKRLPKNCYY